MFALELVRGGETRTFAVTHVPATGWQLTEEVNGQPVRTVTYTDWHRVERAIAIIRLDADVLERNGWNALVQEH